MFLQVLKKLSDFIAGMQDPKMVSRVTIRFLTIFITIAIISIFVDRHHRLKDELAKDLSDVQARLGMCPGSSPSDANGLVSDGEYNYIKPMSVLRQEYLDYVGDIKTFDDRKIAESGNRIIYNRIAKCGSETINEIISRILAEQNSGWKKQMYFVRGEKHDLDFQDEDYARQFVADWREKQEKFIYIRPYLPTLFENRMFLFFLSKVIF